LGDVRETAIPKNDSAALELVSGGHLNAPPLSSVDPDRLTAAFGFVHCSRLRVEKTGRDRGVRKDSTRKAPRFLPALPSDRAEVSPNLRVLTFASAAGGDALKQDDIGHWERGGVG
jgi:hypothetical protein